MFICHPWQINRKITSPNRSVYASGAVAPSGYEKPQSAYGLGAVFLRHIFAVAGMLRIPLSQPQNVIYSRNVMRNFA
jgi:hypothetical protein